MARIATARLRRKSDGREITVNQADYVRNIARWNGWKLIGTTHGDEPSTRVAIDGDDGGPEETDWLSLSWPELRRAVGGLKGVAKTPRTKAAALAILREQDLLPRQE